MNKHTPAPWYLQMPNRKRKATQYDHNQEVLVMAHNPCGFSIATVGGPSNIEEFETWKANARLIAAAPELLDKLKMLVNICTHPQATKADMKLIAEEARAAITKAE